MVIVNEISNTAWTNPLSQETVFYFYVMSECPHVRSLYN